MNTYLLNRLVYIIIKLCNWSLLWNGILSAGFTINKHFGWLRSGKNQTSPCYNIINLIPYIIYTKTFF